MKTLISKLVFFISLTHVCSFEINPRNTKIWGPGLLADRIVMPARYFFIHAYDTNDIQLTSSPGEVFTVTIVGHSSLGRHCRAGVNQLDLGDGSFIIRYKIYQTCYDFEIHIKFLNEHVADSPYRMKDSVMPEECSCPVQNFNQWFEHFQCKKSYPQIENDLTPFNNVNFDLMRKKVIEKYNHPARSSFCNYVIKENKIYRKCYGQHVGFKMFTDSILLALTRRVFMPDMELFMNLGDWPLVSRSKDNSTEDLVAMFSWCGSNDTTDIVLPTYDITESTLENMGRVMLDMLSVQSHAGKIPWSQKQERVFWRGRDSRRERLTLIDIAREHPDLFNVSLTNFFFFRTEEERYGPKTKYVSFFEFFQNKYQLNIDGTVAAYRFPYLLAGNSLVLKQESKYYEFFYKDLQPWEHYVPVAYNLSDLVDRVNWAKENDLIARRISEAGQKYARENLLPQDIVCYHAALFKKWASKLSSRVNVLEDMEYVPQPTKQSVDCQCKSVTKDEL